MVVEKQKKHVRIVVDMDMEKMGRNVILAMVMVSSMIIVIDVVVTGKYKKNVIVEDSGVELCKIPNKYQYPPKSL
ncbi:hypothetical protein ACM15_15520 [Parabacteroides goldsteinii]|uniref:Transmembrane protein n=2 Tax=Parabacteroides goldsteinii TaxID=328812 RepID=A0A0J6C988_9BACT|nr:hypothetical protein ACM15_15520 [Parabacteroides goldsteinii]